MGKKELSMRPLVGGPNGCTNLELLNAGYQISEAFPKTIYFAFSCRRFFMIKLIHHVSRSQRRVNYDYNFLKKPLYVS